MFGDPVAITDDRAIGIKLLEFRGSLEVTRTGRRAHVTEVAAAFGHGWNRLVISNRRFLVAKLLREEKESLLLIAVVHSGDINRSPDGEPEVIAPIKRRFPGLVKKVARVKEFVANKFVATAVKIG